MRSFSIKQFRSPRGCLSYIVSENVSGEAVAIDPSAETGADAYRRYLTERGLKLVYAVDTHTHADHLSLSRALKKETGAPVAMHRTARASWKDCSLEDGDTLAFGKKSGLLVLATPGHTDDSISLLLKDGDASAVFTGDTLLIGGTGRTDLQGGSSEALYRSLWEKLVPLGDETIVYPGHSYTPKTTTTIGGEKKKNPRFLMSKDAFVKTMNKHCPPKPDIFSEAIEGNTR